MLLVTVAPSFAVVSASTTTTPSTILRLFERADLGTSGSGVVSQSVRISEARYFRVVMAGSTTGS